MIETWIVVFAALQWLAKAVWPEVAMSSIEYLVLTRVLPRLKHQVRVAILLGLVGGLGLLYFAPPATELFNISEARLEMQLRALPLTRNSSLDLNAPPFWKALLNMRLIYLLTFAFGIVLVDLEFHASRVGWGAWLGLPLILLGLVGFTSFGVNPASLLPSGLTVLAYVVLVLLLLATIEWALSVPARYGSGSSRLLMVAALPPIVALLHLLLTPVAPTAL